MVDPEIFRSTFIFVPISAFYLRMFDGITAGSVCGAAFMAMMNGSLPVWMGGATIETVIRGKDAVAP